MRCLIIDLTCRTGPYDVHLARALRDAGQRAELWTAGCLPAWKKAFPELSTSPLVDRAGHLMVPWPVRKSLKAMEYIYNLNILQRSLRQKPPEVLHLQWLPFLESAPKIDWWLLRRARMLGTKIVYTAHNVLPHSTGRAHAQQYKRVYNYVDAIICHTENARDRLRELGISEERVRVIPHGPLFTGADCEDAELSNVESSDSMGAIFDQPIVLFFGNIKRYKGLEFLLEAWPGVLRESPQSKLVLAGRGEPSHLRELEQRIQSLGVDKSVDRRFYFLPEPELSSLLRSATVVVYPYREITQSGALLAAMNAGKAIVATRVGGFPETLKYGEAGALVDYGDRPGLTKAILSLIRSSEKRILFGTRARKRVEVDYSWEQIAQKTIECYRSVVPTRK